MTHRRFLNALVIGALFCMASCDNGDDTAAPGAAGNAGAAGDAGASGNGGEAGASAQETLDDRQIVQVLMSANTGEIALANLAQTRATSADVRSFAQMMITDHGAANDQIQTLSSTKGWTPQSSATSQMLESDTMGVMNRLDAAAAADFDRMYVTSQVDMHQKVLDLIDRQLMPMAMDADLKALLANVRATVASHLARAQALVAML